MKPQQMDLMLWFGAMFGCHAAMSEQEREDLALWESANLDGLNSTSDWPGWNRYIGKLRPAQFACPTRTAKKKIASSVRMQVFARDGFRCKLCLSVDRLTIDHITAESKGGTHDIDNLQTLCRSCNSRKGTR